MFSPRFTVITACSGSADAFAALSTSLPLRITTTSGDTPGASSCGSFCRLIAARGMVTSPRSR